MEKPLNILLSTLNQNNQIFRLFENVFQNEKIRIETCEFNPELQLLVIGETWTDFMDRSFYLYFFYLNDAKLRGNVLSLQVFVGHYFLLVIF